ncbi:MAG: hypothetical protein H7X95_03515 [Deltaproteobacteria bacterium]|nr:hypothetical protein [Deltaproteobacteria bacterium]
MTPTICWVCSEQRLRPYWSDPALTVIECMTCGHLRAVHARARAGNGDATDYHLSYDQEGFLASLAATRKRQAERILDALERVSACRALFDFGCGRGWFLDAAWSRGFGPLGGGDASPMSVALLRNKGIPAVALGDDALVAPVDFKALGFIPEIISFLDVIEHFDGDLSARLSSWIHDLPDALRLVVLKVPVREGVMFSAAAVARRLGLPGPSRQLFQVGTYPPHFQYFSRNSLDRFVKAIGLRVLDVFDDLEFEAESLTERAAPLRRLPQGPVIFAARALADVARRLGRMDTRIVIASR